MKIGTFKSLIPTFYTSLFSDVQKHAPEYETAHLDLRYILNRYNGEGVKFVAHVLPNLGKAVVTSLISLNPLKTPMGFELYHGDRLPKLLHFPLSMGFSGSGCPLYDIRDLRSSKARAFSYYLWVVRQVTLAFSKVEDIPCCAEEQEILDSFEDRVTKSPIISCSSHILSRARALVRKVCYEDEQLHPSLVQWEENPFGLQGPGAVCGRERGRDKWRFSKIPGLNPSLFNWRDGVSDDWDPRDSKGYSRVQVVPKDYSSLRTICIESKEMQFAQQGLMRVLYFLLQSNPITKESISFSDQSRNFNLSRDYRFSTIDLKDASDRVSKTLCRIILGKPLFSLLTRYSSRGLLRNERVIRLESLATMGSAICFPIETLVFWCITRATIESLGLAPFLRVFGDDIICPLRAHDKVISVLESCGFVVNQNKTCRDTLIRESCGSYWWCGDDIRIVRFGRTTYTSPTAWMELQSGAKFFSEFGCPESSSAILTYANELWDAKAPVNRRYNKALQRAEVKVPVPCVKSVGSALPGYTGMYAWIVGSDTHPTSSGTVKVKRRWVTTQGLLGLG